MLKEFSCVYIYSRCNGKRKDAHAESMTISVNLETDLKRTKNKNNKKQQHC